MRGCALGWSRRHLNDNRTKQRTHVSRYGHACHDRVWSVTKIEPQPNESETMTTYLTLFGMFLLVVFPVLIPLTVTVIHLGSARFGRIASWRNTALARPVPGPVPVLSDLPGVRVAPSPA
jgi:hypothetical protein